MGEKYTASFGCNQVTYVLVFKYNFIETSCTQYAITELYVSIAFAQAHVIFGQTAHCAQIFLNVALAVLSATLFCLASNTRDSLTKSLARTQFPCIEAQMRPAFDLLFY